MKNRTELFTIITLIFFIVIPFTIIDFIVHSFIIYAVPFNYFTYEILFGILYGVIIYLLLQKVKNIYLKSFLFSIILATALQVNYYILGYSKFVVEFFFIHGFILFIVSIIMFIDTNLSENKQDQ
jgi:hypothetical protein